jgi:hypothetical protein
MHPRVFRTAAADRKWLDRRAGSAQPLWVSHIRCTAGETSITGPESADHATCFGWIDGTRKSADEERFLIRFPPRKPTSIRGSGNLKRGKIPPQLGWMQAPGRPAFGARRQSHLASDSFEQRQAALA